MKLLTSFLALFLLACCAFTQADVASIEDDLDNRKNDTTLIADYLLLADYYRSTDSAKSYLYSNQALDLSNLLVDKLWKGRSLESLGKYHAKWEFDLQTIGIYYQQALEHYRAVKADQDELEVTLKLGGLYTVAEEGELALNHYLQALERHQGDDRYCMIINNAIGVMMKGIGEGETAIQYMDESEKFYKQIENPDPVIIGKQISNDKNRGVVYRNNESYDTAEFYFDRALAKAIEQEDSIWMASVYNSIGLMYEKQNLFLQAIEMFEKSLVLKRAQNYQDGVKTTLTNIGGLYVTMGNYSQAKLALEEAEQIQGRGIRPVRQMNVLNQLAILYYETGKTKLAYEKLREYMSLSDSIELVMDVEGKRELEAKYQNNLLKAEEDKLKAELTASSLREQANAETLKQQRIFMILGISFTIILLLLVVIAIRSNVKRKAANEELSKKNVDIINKSAEIELQKHQIEEKNQEIIDSINYAKRIQDAILPNPVFFKTQLPESFIFYQPKDILAGDFYWMDVAKDTVIWAAADCTGHGIPGALVSVVCHNALNRSVHEFGLIEPGEILDATRKLVVETFKKSGMEVKDGMDIALCCMDKNTKTLKFAGANNPLWLIRANNEGTATDKDLLSENGAYLLREIKGDKQPIGLHYSDENFTSHQVELEKDDLLYVFTDGFADQFGGEKGKKLKYKNFKKMVLEHATDSISSQGSAIDAAFNKWKGDFEQLDDVCVIGVRV